MAPQVSSTLLFAALEAKGAPTPYTWNTVAIAGLDGYARAKATFIPMPTPYVGCAGPVIPRSAFVAAGQVYFADGTGTIRSLAPGGQPAAVTRFPMTSQQQMLSFAVKPDGSRLLGAVFTLPPRPAQDLTCQGPTYLIPGNFALDVYAAAPGQAATLLYHQDLVQTSNGLPNVMEFIGWDATGPEGTYPTAWATQGGGPHHYDGEPVRIDADTGKVTAPISNPSTCSIQDIAPSGDFLCVTSGSSPRFSVRRPDGSEQWGYPVPPDSPYFLEFISPDESHMLAVGSQGTVINRDGTVTAMSPANFTGTGWLDSKTVISGGYGANFGYVALNAPGTLVDIGFSGMFIGTVRG